jgi:hypothetical protein
VKEDHREHGKCAEAVDVGTVERSGCTLPRRYATSDVL